MERCKTPADTFQYLMFSIICQLQVKLTSTPSIYAMPSRPPRSSCVVAQRSDCQKISTMGRSNRWIRSWRSVRVCLQSFSTTTRDVAILKTALPTPRQVTYRRFMQIPRDVRPDHAPRNGQPAGHLDELSLIVYFQCYI